MIGFVRIVAILLFGLVPAAANAQWIAQLSPEVRESILWSADHEDATLDKWQEPGVTSENLTGGILNTPGEGAKQVAEEDVQAAISETAHSGKYSVATTINNAVQARNGNRAVRLMRWADKPWKDGGEPFPKAAYYSTWMMIPHAYNTNKYAPWDPGDGGWWIVFEFKSHDDENESQTAWTLNAYHNDETGKLEFGLNFHLDGFKDYAQPKPVSLPIGEWFHVEAFYAVSTKNDGAIRVWQDGKKIFDIEKVKTASSAKHDFAVWGLTNYTDHIVGGKQPGSATIYFDDAIVSTRRISKVFENQKAVSLPGGSS